MGRVERTDAVDRFLNWTIWLSAAAIPVVWIGGIFWLALVLTSEPETLTRDSLQRTELMIAASQAVLALTLAGATIYYAKRTGDMVRLMELQSREGRRSKREDAVHALLGAAMESAGFAGSLAESQRIGLKWYRRVLPESRDVRDLRVRGWIQLSTAVSHVATAMERIRLVAPDLTEKAGPLFDSVLEASTLATEGRTRQLTDQAKTIRDRAEELRKASGLLVTP